MLYNCYAICDGKPLYMVDILVGSNRSIYWSVTKDPHTVFKYWCKYIEFGNFATTMNNRDIWDEYRKFIKN